MRSWSAARTSSRAATAATAPGSARRRWIRTWCGRRWWRWRKARESPRRSSGRGGVSAHAENLIGARRYFREENMETFREAAKIEPVILSEGRETIPREQADVSIARRRVPPTYPLVGMDVSVRQQS